MAQSQNVKIPTPLHAQLKALAEKRKTTMVAILHDVVRRAIRDGEIPDETPGFSIRLVPAKEEVEIRNQGEIFAYLNAEAAQELAANVKEVVETHAQGPNGISLDDSYSSESISVGYRGTGIVFRKENMYGDVKRFVTTPQIALDIALKLESCSESLSKN